MAEEPRTKGELSDEELEAENGEELPDRETMMILDPGPMPVAGTADLGPFPFPESEAPDDRYEQ